MLEAVGCSPRRGWHPSQGHVQTGLSFLSHRATGGGFFPCCPQTFPPFGSLFWARCCASCIYGTPEVSLWLGLWAVYQGTDVFGICVGPGEGKGDAQLSLRLLSLPAPPLHPKCSAPDRLSSYISKSDHWIFINTYFVMAVFSSIKENFLFI